ncbi:MAG: hypothetical protein EOO64_06285 [Massilia sp.]|nr:MAG: hypothetical protein EOO64_06285 [Massilia sp.]
MKILSAAFFLCVGVSLGTALSALAATPGTATPGTDVVVARASAHLSADGARSSRSDLAPR